jgi:hypothetical protein
MQQAPPSEGRVEAKRQDARSERLQQLAQGITLQRHVETPGFGETDALCDLTDGNDAQIDLGLIRLVDPANNRPIGSDTL